MSNASNVIKYDSNHPDVKIHKEDLGTTGTNDDGVDGVFGPKTGRAAKKG